MAQKAPAIDEAQIKRLRRSKDYQLYYCLANKRNFLTLGYFGGGAVNITQAYEMAQTFADVTGFPLESIHIDEVTKSRHMKHFQVMWSSEPNQQPLPTATELKSFWDFAQD
jgi:hypothetical protein